MGRTSQEVIRFEEFVLDIGAAELLGSGEAVPVEPQVFDLIVFFARNPDRLITRDDLIENVWGGRIISDSAISSRINAARQALGDDGSQQRIIKTVHGRGFRFGVVPSISRVDGGRPAADTFNLPDEPSIVVLPFTTLADEREQDYFADGLTEDVITGLSRIKAFFVIARNSAFAYKGIAVDVREVARDLGVRYIVEGSVRRSGDRFRVSSQLVDAIDGRQIWAENTDRRASDLIDLQDDIAQAIVASVQTQILLHEGKPAPQAHKSKAIETLNGAWREAYKLTEDSLAVARLAAEQVLEGDPANSRACLILAFALHHAAYLGFVDDRAQTFGEAIDAGRKAIALDDGNEYCHWILGSSLSQVGEFEEAILELNRAIEINHNCSLAHGSLGTVHAWSGETQKAMAATRHALRTNPRDPANFLRYLVLALCHFAEADYDTALHHSSVVVQRKPEWFLGHLIRLATLGQMGSHKVSPEEEKQIARLRFPPGPDTVNQLPLASDDVRQRLIEGLATFSRGD